MIKGKKIEGSWGGGINPDKDLKIIVDNLSDNRLFIEMINQDIYKLDDINKAIDDMQNGKVLRPIIKMH